MKNTFAVTAYAAAATFLASAIMGETTSMFISFMILGAAGFSAVVLDAVM